MVHYGFDKYEAEKILKKSLDKEPDLKYYMNNDYMEKLVDILIEGIANVIEENNTYIKYNETEVIIYDLNLLILFVKVYLFNYYLATYQILYKFSFHF